MTSSFLIKQTPLNAQQTPFDAALESPDFQQATNASAEFPASPGAYSTARAIPTPSSGAASSSGGQTHVITSSGSAFVINATIGAGAPAGFVSAVTDAIQYFEHTFTNALTMNITFNWSALGGNAIAQSSTFLNQFSYSSVRSALLAKNGSLVIPTTDPFPAGTASQYELATPANTLWLTEGQATSLGLSTYNSGSNTNSDGTITLNSNLSYNFDPTQGGVSGEFDAAPTLEHEISEMMGRQLGGNNSSGTGFLPTALALFRYNSVSGGIDTSGNYTNDYFSTNGGATNLRSNMGESGGDLADWGDTTSDVVGYGTTGLRQYYTPVDIQTLQAVGWTASNDDYWIAQTDAWSTQADWSNGVPTSNSVVYIQQGDPQITSAATAASIEVETGAALSIGAALTLGSAGLTLDSGSTVHFPSIQSTSFAIQLTGNATIDTGSTSFDDDVLGGVISGAGGLSTTGGSNLALNGNNTFQGGVTANGGAWVALLGSANGLGTGALTLAGSELILGINATVANNIFLRGADLIHVNASDNATLGGTIADSGGAGTLYVNGPGTLTLSGSNTYTGGTIVESGSTLSVNNSANIANGALTLDNGSTLAINPAASPSFGDAIALNGAVTINTGFVTNNYESLNGIVSGSGSLSLTGGSNLALNGNNTFQGGVTANGEAWVALMGSANGLGTGALTLKGGSRLILGINNTVANNIFVDASSSLFVDASDDTTLSGTIADISGGGAGSVLVNGPGTLTLSGANTYTGGTTVETGATLSIDDSANIANGALTLDGGSTLVLNPSGSPSFADAVTLNGAATINTGSVSDNYESLNGIVSGSGSLSLTGGSNLALNDDNTFQGGVTANGDAWVALLGSANGLGTGALTLTSGAELILGINATVANNIFVDASSSFFVDASDDTTLSGTIADISGGGAGSVVVDGTGTLTLSGANTYSGGTEVFGGATLAISDDDSVGTGTLTLDAGATLKVMNDVALSVAIDLVGNATIDSSGTYSNFYGAISGAGSLTLLTGGGGSPGLQTANSYTGGTTATGGGRIYIGNDDALGTGALTLDHTNLFADVSDIVANNISIDGVVGIGTASATLSGIISDGTSAGGIVLDDGTLTLTGANTYSGGTEVEGGTTLSISNDDSVGTGTLTLDAGATLKIASYVELSVAIDLAGNATIDSSGTYSNFYGAISGAGSLTLLTGGGSPGLQSANSYTGGTTATGGGRIFISNDDALGTGALTLDHTNLFADVSDIVANNISIDGVVDIGVASATLSGIVSDGTSAGGFVLDDGTLTLTGANTYSGGTTIDSGTTLATAGAGTLGTGGVTVNSGGTLSIGAGSTPSITGTSDFEGTVSGAGTWLLGVGTATIGSGATISVAKWSIQGANVTVNKALTYSGAFAMGTGSVLDIAGGALTLKGATTLTGGATAGAQRLQLQGATSLTGAVTIGGSSGVSNFATLTESGGAGALTLGDSSGAAVSFNNTASGVLDIANNNGVKLGIGANSTISNSGLIEKTAGGGVSIISASLSGGGEIKAQTGTLELAGASNSISGKLDGAGKIFLSGGVTTLTTGATVSAPTFTLLGGGTVLRVQANVSYGGAFTVNGGASVAISAPDTLTLTGTSSLFGAISGGTLAMTGGASTVVSTATFGMANWTSSGVALGMTGQHVIGGVFSASSETITFNSFLRLNGTSTLTSLKLAGSGQLQVEKASTVSGGLTLGGTSSVSNFATLTQSGGNVVLGDTSGGAAKIANNGAAAIWKFNGDYGVTLGNSAVSSIANSGTIEKSAGSGVSVIAAVVANGGKLEALSGTLDIKKAVTATGTDIVSGASTLEFEGSVGGGQTVQFQGAGSTLDLTNWSAFAGKISDFDMGGASNDAIDVLGPWTYVGFNSNNDMMTFADGSTQHSVRFTGSYIAADFHANPITGGTQVTYG